MPEAPEVKRFVEAISKFIGEGCTINSLEVISGRYLKEDISGGSELRALFPLKIKEVSCKGKFIYWKFEGTDLVIFNTLGMSGSWNPHPRKHERVRVQTSSGNLHFNDPRNFGTLKVANEEALQEKLSSLGPDVLSIAFDIFDFMKRIKKKPRLTLAEAIMDQSTIAGVGNYLKSDSLWLAKLSPHRVVATCSDTELMHLSLCARRCAMSSFESGGSTILTYRGFDDKEGRNRFLVYSQDEDPDGREVISERTLDGRTSWWVPGYQV